MESREACRGEDFTLDVGGGGGGEEGEEGEEGAEGGS